MAHLQVSHLIVASEASRLMCPLESATAPCEIRRSFDGLHGLVVSWMHFDAFDGDPPAAAQTSRVQFAIAFPKPRRLAT